MNKRQRKKCFKKWESLHPNWKNSLCKPLEIIFFPILKSYDHYFNSNVSLPYFLKYKYEQKL